jgi:hypothetical protein
MAAPLVPTLTAGKRARIALNGSVAASIENHLLIGNLHTAVSEAEAYFAAPDWANGGITRAKLGYASTAGVAVQVFIPATRGAKVTAHLTGDLRLEATLTSKLDDITDTYASQQSSRFQELYNSVKQSFKTRASGGYFCFFQVNNGTAQQK